MPGSNDDVFLGRGTVVPGCEQDGSEKNCRRRLAGQEYRVLLQFGDQLGDFVEVADTTQAARAALLDEYGDWFGERWWMVPKPTYGGGEPALFDNDWDLPRAGQMGGGGWGGRVCTAEWNTGVAETLENKKA